MNQVKRHTFIRVKRNPRLPKCDNCRVKIAMNELFRSYAENGVHRYWRTHQLCQACTNEEVNEESAFINREETELLRG